LDEYELPVCRYCLRDKSKRNGIGSFLAGMVKQSTVVPAHARKTNRRVPSLIISALDSSGWSISRTRHFSLGIGPTCPHSLGSWLDSFFFFFGIGKISSSYQELKKYSSWWILKNKYKLVVVNLYWGANWEDQYVCGNIRSERILEKRVRLDMSLVDHMRVQLGKAIYIKDGVSWISENLLAS
jgi:hypothetical protein